jgi:hypothetical protein
MQGRIALRQMFMDAVVLSRETHQYTGAIMLYKDNFRQTFVSRIVFAFWSDQDGFIQLGELQDSIPGNLRIDSVARDAASMRRLRGLISGLDSDGGHGCFGVD